MAKLIFIIRYAEDKARMELLSRCFSGEERIFCAESDDCLATAEAITKDESRVVPLSALNEAGESETISDFHERVSAALKAAQAESDNVILVTYSDVMTVALAGIKRAGGAGLYAFEPSADCAAVLCGGADGLMLSALRMPDAVPDAETVSAFLDICGTPENVRAHCREVRARCIELSVGLKAAGVQLSYDCLEAAALMHDMCRTLGREHPQAAGGLLRLSGYLETARTVELHHDITYSGGELTAAHLLFYADKLAAGTRRTALRERFEASEARCRTPEARTAHSERLKTALSIQRRLAELLKENK